MNCFGYEWIHWNRYHKIVFDKDHFSTGIFRCGFLRPYWMKYAILRTLIAFVAFFCGLFSRTLFNQKDPGITFAAFFKATSSKKPRNRASPWYFSSELTGISPQSNLLAPQTSILPGTCPFRSTTTANLPAGRCWQLATYWGCRSFARKARNSP